jgi:FixJ family two-component response regulator
MPHVDGEQCFRELKRIKSDVKIIMSSGFNEQEVSQKFAGKGLTGFIQKPYKLSVLKDVIQKNY